MIDPQFVLLGAAVSLTGAMRYCRETLAGRVVPNRVTWLLWALAPLIAFAVEISAGVGLPAVLTLSVGVGPALVFVCSVVSGRTSRWTPTRFDIGCGGMSVLALILWALTGSGSIAVALSIAADALAGAPTLRKAIVAPESEHPAPFLAGTFNGAITLLTIRHWNFGTFGFPVYIALVSASLCLLTLRGAVNRTVVLTAGLGGAPGRSPRRGRARP